MKGGIETLATKDDVADFKKEISEARVSLIRWMFIFWIAQVGATLLIFLYVVKK